MPGPKRVPAEVIAKARTVAASTKQYTVAPAPKPPPVTAPSASAATKKKVVAALKRLHPMD